MDSMFFIVDVLVLVFGVYILYNCWKLRRAGCLIESKLLYPSGCSADNCRDAEGFYAYILPRYFILGLCAVVDGAVTVLNDFFGFLPTMPALMMNVLFLGFVIYYGVIISKSFRTYFQ